MIFELIYEKLTSNDLTLKRLQNHFKCNSMFCTIKNSHFHLHCILIPLPCKMASLKSRLT